MSNNQLISVVMSVYNDEKFLSDAIESILKQSNGDFEFIIVNDGSTDNSAVIISSFQKLDKRIVFIDRKENKGLPYSLNESIALAKGKYIARMDSDDVAVEDRFEKQINFLELRPDIDILGGQEALIDSKGLILKSSKKPLLFNKIKKSAEFVCPINHPTYMVKKNVYLTLGCYRDSFVYAQDYDFILRAIDYGFIIENMPDKLLYYRSFKNMHSTFKRQRQLYLARYALKLHKERVRDGIESVRTLEKLKRTSFNANVFFALSWNLRNKVLRKKFPKYVSYVLAFLSSLLHYEVFNASLRGFLYAKYKR